MKHILLQFETSKGGNQMDRKKSSPRGEGYAGVIRAARLAAGLNQQQLADQLGLSRNTIAGWETGHSRPDLDSLPSLCRILGISFTSFFGIREPVSPGERRLIKAYRSLDISDRQAILWQIEALSAGRAAMRQEKGAGKKAEFQDLKDRVVSVFRSELSAAAGTGSPLDASHGSSMWLKKDDVTSRADEILTVNGLSMEPTFHDGDQVLVEHTDWLREGEIGVFTVDGEGFIKEYRKDGLHSHNPDYPTMKFGEGNDVRCIGRVLGLLKEEQLLTDAEQNWMEENQ